MRIHLLGTGGALNECRHQASLLLDAGSGRRLLLDTGNGLDTVKTMIRLGCDPRSVRDIFVSHRHLDHAGGLEPLLLWVAAQARGDVRDDVRVYAEPRTLEALRKQWESAATVVPRLYGHHLQLRPITSGDAVPIAEGLSLTPFSVDHLPAEGGALGCLLEVDGRRIAYSGDTRPSPSLVSATTGVEILFHEAGGLDSDAGMVHTIGHSTAGDAARAAKAAAVQRLVLTHFPNEDSIDPMLAEAVQTYDGPIDLAQDLGHIDL